MFKFLRYRDVVTRLLNSPAFLGADSIEGLENLWGGYHMGLTDNDVAVLYRFNFGGFNLWLAFKSNLMTKNRLPSLYKEYFLSMGIDVYSKGNTELYAALLREFMSINPSKIYKDKDEDSMIFVIYYNSILPWRIIQIDDKDVIKYDFLCTCTYKKDSIKEATLKKKYLKECKRLLNKNFSKDLDADFAPYNLDEFIEKYYYKDYKAEFSIYSMYKESAE